jgi:uncharacterized integral membrane protein
MATTPDEIRNGSIGDLLRRLVADIGHLFRSELRLAQSEVAANFAAMRGGAVMIAAGAGFFIASLFALIAAAIGWLTPLVGAGWAAFIVAIASAVIGGILIAVGAGRLKHAELAPRRAFASLKEDAKAIEGEA